MLSFVFWLQTFDTVDMDVSIEKNAEHAIVNFLQTNVPKTDIAGIEAELKKDFIFAKRKSKGPKTVKTKKKSKTLTRKERNALGFYVIPRNGINYADVKPMNQIWESYMGELLDLDKPIPDCTSKSWDQFTQSVYRADFHGSLLEVVRSKCPSYVGKKGICVMDTKNTFKIVSINNELTTIPKRECVFDMYINKIKITLFGKHLCIRPAERSTKKIKSILLPDLL